MNELVTKGQKKLTKQTMIFRVMQKKLIKNNKGLLIK